MINNDEISRLESELKLTNETLRSSLKERHDYIENTFYTTRNSIISNYKSYLVNLVIVTATIIPFSSLVFQIPPNILKVNVSLWLIALLIFISSLTSFILCFLKLIDIEKGFYIKLFLSYLGSSHIDFVSISDKKEDEKIMDMVDVLNSQDQFQRDHKNYINEEDFIGLLKRIKISSWLFITGLTFFLFSIIFWKFVDAVCTKF